MKQTLLIALLATSFAFTNATAAFAVKDYDEIDAAPAKEDKKQK